MIAAIRIRGRVDVPRKISDTLRMLSLNKKNNCVLVKEENVGMLRKAQNYLTWGKIDITTLGALLAKRARLPGDKRLNTGWLKNHGFISFEDLAKKVDQGEVDLEKLKIKKVFRLTPPSKGFKLTLRQTWPKGELGNRGEKINELLKRMI